MVARVHLIDVTFERVVDLAAPVTFDSVFCVERVFIAH
jgi:hypothetical protein